ncbi:alpha-glycosidase [Cohnella sp. GCM10027633]|uniref:alpha-glycosidase n=1 Tax=unclassified Cohnella TaxID=2636738 RepID=UPI00362BA223
MLKEAIHHINDVPYLFPIGETEAKVRIRSKRGDVEKAYVLHADRYTPPGSEKAERLTKVASTEAHDYYEGVLRADTQRIRYAFLLEGRDGERAWIGENGVSEDRKLAGYFHCPFIGASWEGAYPTWADDAIVYEIFPERFRNGDAGNDPPGAEPWDSQASPTPQSRYGGDLQGIIEKLPYLRELGVNLVYMTPLFRSPSNHKYNIDDYYEIDPAFGTAEDVKRLVDAAHALGMKVMLDAVFNHSGDGFFAFRDVMANGEASPYKDWFFVRDYPVVQRPVPNYATFGSEVTMPKLNCANPEARRYMLDFARHWVERYGIDGWRLDVANEVDHSFWRELRDEIKGIDGELLLVGEIMHHSAPWLRGDMFDGVMNYPLRDAIVEFFAVQMIGARAFVGRFESIRMQYTDRANRCMFNLLGSHDTERFLTACGRSEWGWNEKREKDRLRLAMAFLFTYVGMPMLYYGDEVGMDGAHDPGCRKPMEWDESRQDVSLREYCQRLIALRKEHRALSAGDLRVWFADDAKNTFGYIRYDEDETLGVILNNSPVAQRLELQAPEGFAVLSVQGLFGGTSFSVNERRAIIGEVPSYGAAVIQLMP